MPGLPNPTISFTSASYMTKNILRPEPRLLRKPSRLGPRSSELFLLLFLLAFLRRGFGRSLGAFLLGLLLALLDDFGLGRRGSSGFRSGLRRRRDFLFHRHDVRDRR